MAFLFVKAMTSGGPNGASEVALSYIHPGEYQRALEYGNAFSALKNTIPGDLLCTDLKEIQGIIKEHKSTGRIAEMDR